MKKTRLLCLLLIVIISLITLSACLDESGTADSQYYVTIVTNNGEEDIHWDSTKAIPEILYAGYKIEGFYLDKEFTTAITLESLKSVGFSNKITVYVKWTKDGEGCVHEIVVDQAVNPTCTETGLTEGSHCSKCNEVIVAQTVVDSLGHNYSNVTYKWSEDYLTCTATGICTRDNTHILTETVDATQTVTQEKTCALKELSKFTAAFRKAVFATQTKEGIITADIIAHDYNAPTYEWSADYSTCTATRVCKADKTHIETETVNSTSSIAQNKSCVLDELTTYTATFTNAAFAVQTKENIKTADALKHNYENDICTRCKEEKVSEGLTYAEYKTGYKVTGIGTCEDLVILVPQKYNDKDVLYIDANAFKDNTTITSIKVSKNIESIGVDAFKGCTALKTIIIDSTSIPKNLTSSSSQGYLIKYATKIYIPSAVTDTSEYVKGIYTKADESDKEGYSLYTFTTGEVKLTGFASQEFFDGTEDATTSADDPLYIEAGIYVNGIFRCNTVAGGYFYLHCKHGDIITSWMYWRGQWWLCIFVYTVTDAEEQNTEFAFNTYLVSGKTYYCGVKTNAVVKAKSSDPESEDLYYITETNPDFAIYFVEGSTLYFEANCQKVNYRYELKDVHKAILDMEINFLPQNYNSIVEAKPHTVSGNISLNSGDVQIEKLRLVEVPKDSNTIWSYADLDKDGNFTIKASNESKLYLYASLKSEITSLYIEYIISSSVEDDISNLDLDLVLYSGIETIVTYPPFGFMDTPTKTATTNKSLILNSGNNSYSIKYYLLTNSTNTTIYTVNTIPSGELLGQYTFKEDELTHDFNLEYNYVSIGVKINNYSPAVSRTEYKSFVYTSDEVPNSVVVPIEIISRINGLPIATYNYSITLEEGVTSYTVDFNNHIVKVFFNGIQIPNSMISITHIGSTYDNSVLTLDNFCAVKGDKYKFAINGTSFVSDEITVVDGNFNVNIVDNDYYLVIPKLLYYGADLTSTAVFTYNSVDYNGGEYIYIDSSAVDCEVACTFTLDSEKTIYEDFTGNGELVFDYIIQGAKTYSGSVSYNGKPCLAFVTTPVGVFVGNLDGTFSAPVKDGEEITVSIISGKKIADYYVTFNYSDSAETTLAFTGTSPITYGLYDMSADIREMTFVDITPVSGKYSMLNNVFMYTLGTFQQQYELDIQTGYDTDNTLTSCRVDIVAKAISVTAKEDGEDASFCLWRYGENGKLSESSIKSGVSSLDTSAIIGERLRAASEDLTTSGWFYAKENVVVDENTSSLVFNFEKVFVKGKITINNKSFNGSLMTNTCSSTFMFTPKSGYCFYNYRGNDLKLEVNGLYIYEYSLKDCEDIVELDFNIEAEGLIYTTGKITVNNIGINAILMAYLEDNPFYVLTITESDGSFALFSLSGAAVTVMSDMAGATDSYFVVGTKDSDVGAINMTLSEEDYVHVSGKLTNCNELAGLISMKKGSEPGMYFVWGEDYSIFVLDGAMIMNIGAGYFTEMGYANPDTYYEIDKDGDNENCDFDLSYAE